MRAAPNVLFDQHMMRIALRLAKRGLGRTAPNPSVGAVIADEVSGEIIARGWTQPGGRPHAEKEALRRAGARARGRTMYLTLEPCAHTGRVPTCADAMVTHGLARVVCAIADPNPLISGSGFEQLKAAGITVDVGLMAQDAHWIALGHILRQTQRRPFVRLKLAVSGDGRIAAGDGRPVWITGSEARALGHQMRAEADAIVVGIKTVLADDPELTCRLPGMLERSPDRVVIDNRLRTPMTARVLARSTGAGERRIWIASSATATKAEREVYEAKGATVLAGLSRAAAGHERPRVDLNALLSALAAEGVTRVLVEGGPTLAENFVEEDLVDEAVIFQSLDELGDTGIAVAAIRRFLDTDRWLVAEQRLVGGDRMTRYRRIARFRTEDFV
jgi:diaminohydroxyphosphoribosylaminopyrimidine deaminase/5-amino-6-(5-phosphoribosylamino)uracil reductase